VRDKDPRDLRRSFVVRVAQIAWAGPWTLLGLLLAPFFRKRRRKRDFLLCEGAAWPRRLGWNYRAITFGHVVLCIDDADPGVLAHELEHVRQYERWGPLLVPAYLVASVLAVLRGGHAHRDNVFEAAARRISGYP
jgi:hypothetical protein